MRGRLVVVVGMLVMAGCAGGADPNDPPQTHVGTCTHFQSAVRKMENVPNCEMRTQHTMINGLAPVYPGDRS